MISHDQLNFSENIIGLVVNPTTGIAEDVAEITVRIGYLYKQNQELLLKMVHIVLKYLDEQIMGVRQTLLKEYNGLTEKPDLNNIRCESIPMATAW